jgi:hypothetical protein
VSSSDSSASAAIACRDGRSTSTSSSSSTSPPWGAPLPRLVARDTLRLTAAELASEANREAARLPPPPRAAPCRPS